MKEMIGSYDDFSAAYLSLLLETLHKTFIGAIFYTKKATHSKKLQKNIKNSKKVKRKKAERTCFQRKNKNCLKKICSLYH